MYTMQERVRGAVRRVFVFAWGDVSVFEAAVLPDTPDNRTLFFEGVVVETDLLIQFIRDVISEAGDVVRGTTIAARF